MTMNRYRGSVGGVAASVMLLAALTACGQSPEPPAPPSESAAPTPTIAADSIRTGS